MIEVLIHQKTSEKPIFHGQGTSQPSWLQFPVNDIGMMYVSFKMDSVNTVSPFPLPEPGGIVEYSGWLEQT